MPLRAVATNENSEVDKPERTKENFLALFAEFSALRDKMRAMILVDSKDLKLAVQDKKLASKLSKQSLRAERTMDQLVAYFGHKNDKGNYKLGADLDPNTFNDEKIIRAYAEQLSAFVSMAESLLEEKRDSVEAIIRADNMQQPLEGVLNRMPMIQSRINKELKKAELINYKSSDSSSEEDLAAKDKASEQARQKEEAKKKAAKKAKRKTEAKKKAAKEAELKKRLKAAKKTKATKDKLKAIELHLETNAENFIAKNKKAIGNNMRLEIALEIAMNMDDGSPGFTFEELSKLFPQTELAANLNQIKDELAAIDIELVGSFGPTEANANSESNEESSIFFRVK